MFLIRTARVRLRWGRVEGNGVAPMQLSGHTKIRNSNVLNSFNYCINLQSLHFVFDISIQAVQFKCCLIYLAGIIKLLYRLYNSIALEHTVQSCPEIL